MDSLEILDDKLAECPANSVILYSQIYLFRVE